MRAVVQRVLEASVAVEGQVVGEIRQGLLVFIGVGQQDTHTEALWLAHKIANLRIFSDAEGKMNLSVKAINLNLRQSNFIDSVTHELKSPIASMK